MIFSLDLEGVLAPEIWPVLGVTFGVPEFSYTTRDIAETLFVSPRTVDNHLQRVYGKLGISRRSELADALRGVDL